MPPGFWAGLWSGSMRTVECPYCRQKQTLARRPLPFSVCCKDCRRNFQVTDRGVVASEKPEGRP